MTIEQFTFFQKSLGKEIEIRGQEIWTSPMFWKRLWGIYADGEPMWRRNSNDRWVRSKMNQTYLELCKIAPEDYMPISYESLVDDKEAVTPDFINQVFKQTFG